MKKKNILALSLAAVLTLSLAACGGGKEIGGVTVKDGVTVVTVGAVGANNEMFTTVNELLEKDNIRCEIVEFAEYALPNKALDSGEIAMNAFQHKAYLNNEIAKMDYKLSVLGDTFIAPLRIFSDKITDLSQLQNGDKIAVPMDATNEGRCFKILESAGIIEVDPAAGYTPELKDITSTPLNIEFVEVEAANTASLISDPQVVAAFVNGAHAVDNGLDINDAIYTETVQEGSDNPYINILCVRTDDLEYDVFQKILAAYQTAETAKTIEDVYQGMYIPAFQY